MPRKPAKAVAAKPAKKPAKKSGRKVAKKAPEQPVEEPPKSDDEVFDPPALAHELRLQGYTWPEVCNRTGYTSPATAHAAVQRWLQAGAVARGIEEQRAAFQLQVDRYEAVLKKWWPLATEGRDKDAAAIVLRTLGQLDKLQRFEETDTTSRPTAIVIASDPDSYVRELREIVEANEAAESNGNAAPNSSPGSQVAPQGEPAVSH